MKKSKYLRKLAAFKCRKKWRSGKLINPKELSILVIESSCFLPHDTYISVRENERWIWPYIDASYLPGIRTTMQEFIEEQCPTRFSGRYYIIPISIPKKTVTKGTGNQEQC